MAESKKSTESVAGEDLAGIVVGGPPQSSAEAEEAEANRREGMSESEKQEAEDRDRHAKALLPEGRDAGSIPNLGSPDEEGREDGNDDHVAEEGQTFGTGPDERTAP